MLLTTTVDPMRANSELYFVDGYPVAEWSYSSILDIYTKYGATRLDVAKNERDTYIEVHVVNWTEKSPMFAIYTVEEIVTKARSLLA